MNHSLFDPGEAEAPQELFLKKDERQHQRQADHQRPGADGAPLAAGFGAHGEGDQPDGQHLLIGIVEHHQRPQVLVPVVGNADGGEGQHRRPGHRQQYAEQHLPPAAALHQRRLLQLFRDGEERLTHQEHAERRGEVGHHHPGEGVEQAEGFQGQHVRHHHHHRHDHQLHQEQEKQRLLAAKFVAGEDVAGGGDGQQLHEEGAEGEDKGVGVQAQPVGAVPGVAEVIEGQRQAGQQRRHIVAEGGGAERGGQHPDKRADPQQRQAAH
ncbi:hypothetical protein MTE1_4674 [Klebsiella pneumoniae JHCK1]|nr:hypothetical protein MTE1_4674 [Klebsiella pneumoniae JHCK1]